MPMIVADLTGSRYASEFRIHPEHLLRLFEQLLDTQYTKHDVTDVTVD